MLFSSIVHNSNKLKTFFNLLRNTKINMPNTKNLPTYFDEYVEKAKITKKSYALPQLNTFAFRYLLAESFQGMIAPEVGRTLLGYDVLTKVFLAYTAYESIVKISRKLRVINVEEIEINVIFDQPLAKRIRANNMLKSYLISHIKDVGLTTKINNFYSASSHDIVCVAYALRNVFAHGDLTASSVGTETIAKRKLFTDLANVVLDYCDDRFSDCLDKL